MVIFINIIKLDNCLIWAWLQISPICIGAKHQLDVEFLVYESPIENHIFKANLNVCIWVVDK